MSLSSVKDIWQKIQNPNEIKENKSLTQEDFRLISDYMCQKFIETRQIFSKFNSDDFYSFIEKSSFLEYKEKELIFEKNSPCDSYLFILYGDIDFFDGQNGGSEENNILIKTISAGKVYGHTVKENYKYNIKARINLSLISIKKKTFDDMIENINKLKNNNKFKFIKKFFPKIRLYSDEIINNVLQYFERIKFNKHSKIVLKDEYNEYVYLIIKGTVAFCMRPKGLFHMDKIDKNLINEELISELNSNIYNNDYIIIDKLSRGDVFGINSALKSQKSFYTVVTLTDNVEVYRILKGNILFYFGGSSGILPVALKALGSLQDDSFQLKTQYLKSIDFTKKEIQSLLKEKFSLLFDKKEKLTKNKKIKRGENYFIIDESSIKNNLFEAWKAYENLGSKISEFKSKLLGDTKPKKKNIFGEEISEKETSSSSLKDFGQVKGDATNRVVSRRLNMGLNSNQLRSLDKLNMLCGVNKNGEENIKKVANITHKLEGGGRSKLMSFMRSDDSLTSLEGFSKRANEKDRKKHEEEAKNAELESQKNEKKNEEKKEENLNSENKEENLNTEKKEENLNTEKKEENINSENKEENLNTEKKEEKLNTEKKEENKNIEEKKENKNIEKKEEESLNIEVKEENKNIEIKEENKNIEIKEDMKRVDTKKDNTNEEKKEENINIEKKEGNLNIEIKEEIKNEPKNDEVKKEINDNQKQKMEKEKEKPKPKRARNALRKLRDLE